MRHKAILLTAVFITVSMHTQRSSRCHKVYPRDWTLWASRFEIHLLPLWQKKESQPYPVRFGWRDCLSQLPLPGTMSKASTELWVFPNYTQVGMQIPYPEPGVAELLHTVWCQTRSIKFKLAFWCCHVGYSPNFTVLCKGKSCQIHLNRAEMAPGTTWSG